MKRLALAVLLASAGLAPTDLPEHREVYLQANTPFEIGASHDRQRMDGGAWYALKIVDEANRVIYQTHVGLSAWRSDGFGSGYLAFTNIPGVPPGTYLASITAVSEVRGASAIETLALIVPASTDPPSPIRFPWVVQGVRVQP